MSIRQKISKNIIWLTFGEIISKIFAFITFIIISRYLQEDGFGVYSFVFSLATIFIFLIDLGLDVYSTREIARHKKLVARFVRNILALRALAAILYFTVLYIVTFFLDKPAPVKTLILIAGGFIVLQSFTSFLKAIFRAFEKFRLEVLLNLIDNFGLLILTLVAVWMAFEIQLIVINSIIATGISLIVGLILLHRQITPLSLRIDLRYWAKLIRGGFYFALSSIFIIIYFRVDTVMLSVMKGDAITGDYNAAYNFFYAFTFIPAAFTAVIFPVLSRIQKTDRPAFTRLIPTLYKYFLTVAIVLSLGFLILAPDGISLFYGDSYANAILILQILAFATTFIFINFLTGTILNSVNLQKIGTLATGAGMVLNVIVNLILIPKYSAFGAALATVFTEIIVSVVLVYFLHRHVPLLTGINTFKILKLFSATIFAVLIAMAAMSINAYFAAALAVVIFLTTLYLLKVFRREDVQAILRLLTRPGWLVSADK